MFDEQNLLYTVCVIYKLVKVSKPWNTVVTLENYIVKVSLNWFGYVSLAHLFGKLVVHCMCNLDVNVSKPWNTIVTLGNYIGRVSLNWPGYVSLVHYTHLLCLLLHLHVNHFTRLSQSYLFSDQFKMNSRSAHALPFISLRSCNLNSEA